MPDLKISELPAATTPLDGTELVAIVQAATTRQATTRDISDVSFSTKQAYAFIASDGTIVGDGGRGVDSVTWSCAQPGVYQINYTSGYFSGAPSPLLSLLQNVPRVGYEVIDFGPTSVTVQLYEIDTGAAIDAAFIFAAVGVPA